MEDSAAISTCCVTGTNGRSLLHRAVCFSRSFYDFSAFGIYTCMRSMFKSPIAGLLLLPAGPLKHDMVELGATPLYFPVSLLVLVYASHGSR
jgi:hypothetical protein